GRRPEAGVVVDRLDRDARERNARVVGDGASQGPGRGLGAGRRREKYRGEQENADGHCPRGPGKSSLHRNASFSNQIRTFSSVADGFGREMVGEWIRVPHEARSTSVVGSV